MNEVVILVFMLIIMNGLFDTKIKKKKKIGHMKQWPIINNYFLIQFWVMIVILLCRKLYKSDD